MTLAGASVWSINRDKVALCRSHVAVKHITRINESSRDRPLHVQADPYCCAGPLAGAFQRYACASIMPLTKRSTRISGRVTKHQKLGLSLQRRAIDLRELKVRARMNCCSGVDKNARLPMKKGKPARETYQKPYDRVDNLQILQMPINSAGTLSPSLRRKETLRG